MSMCGTVRKWYQTGHGPVAYDAMMKYAQRVKDDQKMLDDTEDENLPLLVNYKWSSSLLKKKYLERVVLLRKSGMKQEI